MGGRRSDPNASTGSRNFTASAEEKLKAVGGEIAQSSTDEKPEEA